MAFHPLSGGRVLLATGAENAALRIGVGESPLGLPFRFDVLADTFHAVTNGGTYKSLHFDPNLDDALKSISWSEASTGLFLFVSGAREMIRSFKIECSDSSEEPGLQIGVLPWLRGPQAGEFLDTRVMALETVVVDREKEKRLIVAGYSDGLLRVSKVISDIRLIPRCQQLTCCIFRPGSPTTRRNRSR